MADVLAKIVADKRAEIAEREGQFPLSAFKATLKPSQKSFIEALRKKTAGFIFECKKASPSKGLIREHFDLDEIVTAYEKEAACFSVLTDEKYFQGKFEYLEYVTTRVEQPVLNKDFFVAPYQVYLARHFNADAVLLMLSVLNDKEYEALSDLAYSLNMDVLTEVSNEDETRRALALGAQIIGINNRDLRDLSTDLATTERLVPIIREHDFTGVIISESGIYHYQDLLRLNHLVDGYLVGSSLMAQANLNKAVNQLAYGKVKVCGITRTQDARDIASTQTSYMGLIFAPNSPRYISLEQAISIVDVVPFSYVGVFVDAPLAHLVEHVNKLNLAAVQLHGNESAEYIQALREALPQPCDIWKVIKIENGESHSAIQHKLAMYEQNSDAISLYLFDCKVGNQIGGTGQQFDWSLLNKLELSKPFAIAGGIHPDNAKEAAYTYASLIDVNSGVESSPGEKEIEKIHTMFASLRI